MFTENRIENSIKGYDFSAVDVIPDLPADRALRMEHSDTFTDHALLVLKVVV